MEKTVEKNQSDKGPGNVVLSDVERELHCSTQDRRQMAGQWEVVKQ